MTRDDVRLQVIASVGAMFAIRARESTWATFVMHAYMSGEICPSGEGMGAERTLEMEIWV